MHVYISFLLALFIISPQFLWADDNVREETNFNRNWLFVLDNPQHAEKENFDDSQWQPIGLPHSFSTPYFLSRDFYEGYGWYRKAFTLSDADMKKHVVLEFDGVFQEAEVYLNEMLVGGHQGGYTGFEIDLTPAMRKGNNVLAIKVNNLWNGQLAPRGGEHVFSGGIYRNVRLVKKNKTHITWCGVGVTTPSLASHKGLKSDVKVDVELNNTTQEPKKLSVKFFVKDPHHKVVAEASAKQWVIAAGETKQFAMNKLMVNAPLLWSPSTPQLYTLVSKIYDGKKLIDEVETAFGFRWMEWTSGKGFFLNGKHLFFRGANVHQDQAGWGDAVTDEAAARDVKMMKQAGFDMIRGSHYPHSPGFVSACDKEGMLFWSEVSFWGTAGPKDEGVWTAGAYPYLPQDTAAFDASALKQLEEMVRIHRNSPSVFVWSMCNEPFFTRGETMPGVKRLLQKMVDKCHQLDPTRKVALGGVQRPLGKDRLDLIGDVAGYNGDGASIVDFQQPHVPSVVSEYGSTTADRPGRFTPGWGDLNRDEGWKGREWRSGQAIWCGFDHGSIFGSNLGKMGIVDYFRIPKRSWYWYRQHYTGVAPMPETIDGVPARIKVSVSKEKQVRTDGTDDVFILAEIVDEHENALSQSPAVEMKVVSGPGIFPTGKHIRFAPDSDIRIQDGKCAIALRSYYAGSTIVEVSSQGLPATRVHLEFVGDELYKEGVSKELTHLPYTRYVDPQKRKELQVYGLNNPTFASSMQTGFSAGLATDGEPDTYWKPNDDDTSPTWTLDTERGLKAHHVSITFRPSTGLNFKVETSMDNKKWELLADYTKGVMNQTQFTISPDEPRSMRFLRISFSRNASEDIALSEVSVSGEIMD